MQFSPRQCAAAETNSAAAGLAAGNGRTPAGDRAEDARLPSISDSVPGRWILGVTSRHACMPDFVSLFFTCKAPCKLTGSIHFLPSLSCMEHEHISGESREHTFLARRQGLKLPRRPCKPDFPSYRRRSEARRRIEKQRVRLESFLPNSGMSTCAAFYAMMGVPSCFDSAPPRGRITTQPVVNHFGAAEVQKHLQDADTM